MWTRPGPSSKRVCQKEAYTWPRTPFLSHNPFPNALGARAHRASSALAFLFIPGQLKPQEDEYRLLSSDDPTAQAPMGNVVLMFDPASDQATMQALLAKVGARIVDGPMENGGYVLVIEADDLEAGLATLQASEAVVLAQPLGAEGVR